MSTQSSAGVPFSIAADLQPCRLLELPPDLLDYLSTSDAPSLSFKAKDATDPEAFLTTQDKTYLIRQVHTSNTVYITTPSLDASGTTAISQCGSALECLPAPTRHAASTLRSLLISFAEPQDADIRSSDPRSKHHVFAQTPMSHGECQDVWKHLVAFEHAGQSFRPTAAALVKVWKWLLEIAYAHAVNLAAPIPKESIDRMLDGEDEWPRSLVDAILLKLSEHGQESLNLQQQATVKFVGHNLLESRHQSHAEQSTMEKSAFLDAWKDALPEAWRAQTTLDILKAGGKRIEFAPEMVAVAEETTTGATKPAAKATAGKRKWHEKFAAARKQGKPS
ncbi:hypothetical protein D6D19_01135 [Aureobasidium pullulans]|nr:hypothetical protein D6D19_01135 [Aureobasidium pullulans]THY29228.1 hypothetical protein D6D00_03714 [Aureobasidium pullulans]THZ01089.1 hypothetical protein D6C92_01398 [Aureobasidium pullulans]TIA25967.1 hypothetical protein D6C81_01220 [Aureobasidium pullulans]